MDVVHLSITNICKLTNQIFMCVIFCFSCASLPGGVLHSNTKQYKYKNIINKIQYKYNTTTLQYNTNRNTVQIKIKYNTNTMQYIAIQYNTNTNINTVQYRTAGYECEVQIFAKFANEGYTRKNFCWKREILKFSSSGLLLRGPKFCDTAEMASSRNFCDC